MDGDWTRIEPSGIGGMVLGGRHALAVHSRGNRQRDVRTGGFMMEAAEAVIGNILRAGDIQMEAINEIEDTLGIRIINSRGDNENRAPRRGTVIESSHESRNRETTVNDTNLNAYNRGPVGVNPVVNQDNPLENGFSSISNSRLSDLNAMEAVYCGPVIGSGRIYYDLTVSSLPCEGEERIGNFSAPLSTDTQLFSGGPADSTHSRTQHCFHHLLSSVQLPPFNALLSFDRHLSRESGQGDSQDSGWCRVLASSHGNIIRLNRNASNQGDRSSNSGINVGTWTDDGQALDSTSAEFSLAFGEASVAFGQTLARSFVSGVSYK